MRIEYPKWEVTISHINQLKLHIMTNKQKTTLRQFITALILVVICLLADNVSAQTIVRDANGNYVAKAKDKVEAKLLGKTFTTAKGDTYPIYVTEKGKYYIIRRSKESGNEYKQYLNIEGK
jgi:hypothetical protein